MKELETEVYFSKFQRIKYNYRKVRSHGHAKEWQTITVRCERARKRTKERPSRVIVVEGVKNNIKNEKE